MKEIEIIEVERGTIGRKLASLPTDEPLIDKYFPLPRPGVAKESIEIIEKGRRIPVTFLARDELGDQAKSTTRP